MLVVGITSSRLVVGSGRRNVSHNNSSFQNYPHPDDHTIRTKVVLFWWAEKQRAKWRNSFKNGEIFWMNNKAIIEFGFRRIRRILQISEDVIHLGLRPLWITPSLVCRILHILRKPNSIIAKYTAYWCRNEIHSVIKTVEGLVVLPILAPGNILR